MKEKVLNWAQQFNTFCFLDNHQYDIEPHTLECLLAAGVKDKTERSGISSLQKFIDEKKNSWLFGHLNYDLKNELDQLSSHHPDHIQFPDFFFFEPEVLIRLNAKEMIIDGDDPDKVFSEIKSFFISISL